MLAYVVLGGGTLALLPHAPEIEDVVFLIKQHAAYAVLLGRVGIHPIQGWSMLGIAAVTTLLAAAITIFYATFAHPWVALPLTFATIALPIFPVADLLKELTAWKLGHGVLLGGRLVGIALVETLVLWLLAAWIFRDRDIAVAVE